MIWAVIFTDYVISDIRPLADMQFALHLAEQEKIK